AIGRRLPFASIASVSAADAIDRAKMENRKIELTRFICLSACSRISSETTCTMAIANKVANFIRGNFQRFRGDLQKRRYLSKHRRPEPDILRSEWHESLTSPTQFYLR